MVLDIGLLLTVVTQDLHDLVPEFLRHRGCLDLLVQLSVLGPHVAETLGAQGALVLVGAQVFEADHVHRVPADRQPHDLFSRSE